MTTPQHRWRAAYDAQPDAPTAREFNGYRNARTYALLQQSLRRATVAWRGWRVLDAGSGTGDTHAFLTAHNHVTALDFSARMLQRARARYPAAVLGDVEALPFRAGVFDAAIATGVWQCLPTSADFLTALARVVRPGGQVVLGWALNADFVLYRNGVSSRLAEDVTLTPRCLPQMRAEMARAGLRVQAVYAAVYPLGVWRGAGPRPLVPAYTLVGRV